MPDSTRRTIKVFLFAIILLQWFSPPSNAGLIPNSWMDSLVLIEIQKEGDFEPWATGFLVNSKGIKNKILVTNAHVFSENKDKLPLFIRVNKRQPKPNEAMFERLKIFPLAESALQIHKKVDVAVLYVLIPDTVNPRSLRAGEIQDSFFLEQKDVPVGDEILLLGFPASIEGVRKLEKRINIPIIRGGLLSAKFRENDHDLLLIDAPSYWGSSGGPVILRPSSHNVMKDPSGDVPPKSQIEPKLIGVVSGMFAVGREWEVPPKKPKDVKSEQGKRKIDSVWHSGLSTVIPVDYLIELISALPKID